MDWHNNLALQIFRHTQHIDGCHLILHTDGILTERTKRHINIVVLAVFRKVDGEMGVAGMIDVAARRLHQIVDSLIIHICRAYPRQLFPVGTCGISGHDTGPVEGIQRHDLDILDLDRIAGFYRDAAVLWNAPL